MIQKNNKIDAFQIFTLAIMIGNTLFVGMGNIITVFIAKQNTWLVGLISVIIGIIPMLFVNKVMNYEPSLNIFEKNINIFGKVLGNIINLILTLMIAFTLLMILWGTSYFASIKYLTETPILFLTLLFAIPVIYATVKGIETIARVTQIIFFISVVIHFVITSSLLQFIDIENIKPIFSDGIKPIIRAVYGVVVYVYVPLLTILCIPKNNIAKIKKVNKWLILGYMAAAYVMAHVFFVNMSIVGYDVIYMYRYPEYYVIKKLSVSPAFDNVENFLSLHWMFNLISGAFMCSYFIKTYFQTFKKIKEAKPVVINIIIIAVNLLLAYLVCKVFKSTTNQGNFMKNKFPFYIGIPALLLPVITSILIIIKNKINSLKLRITS